MLFIFYPTLKGTNYGPKVTRPNSEAAHTSSAAATTAPSTATDPPSTAATATAAAGKLYTTKIKSPLLGITQLMSGAHSLIYFTSYIFKN